MTKEQLKVQIQMAVFNAFWVVFRAAPKDTWNLATNALRLEETATGWVIYIDSEIAPYMPYTEEKWINRKGQNPNEGWFRNVVQHIAEYLANMLGGSLEVKYV